MIRGDKGTTVRLLIQPNGADPTVRQTVMLVRDEVKLADRLAKAQLIQLPAAKPGGAPVRLGVIALPSFYGEPGAPHHTTSDIRALIGKLKEQHVAGIILDLRGNPGGSLDEAAGCAGLFVGDGPVVQSRYANGQIRCQERPQFQNRVGRPDGCPDEQTERVGVGNRDRGAARLRTRRGRRRHAHVRQKHGSGSAGSE